MISDGNEAMGLRRLTHFSTRYPPRSFFVDRRTASKSVYSRPLGGENNRCRPSGRPVVGLRDMTLGFVLCLALMGSYYCGSMSPTSANASPAGVSDYEVVGGIWDEKLGYVVVNKSNGRVVFSERISVFSLGTADGTYIVDNSRYW